MSASPTWRLPPGSTHFLKTWPPYFQAIASGSKTFELRRNDRGYAVGDILVLREFEPDVERYTDAPPLYRQIIYIYYPIFLNPEDGGLHPDYVVMSIEPQE